MLQHTLQERAEFGDRSCQPSAPGSLRNRSINSKFPINSAQGQYSLVKKDAEPNGQFAPWVQLCLKRVTSCFYPLSVSLMGGCGSRLMASSSQFHPVLPVFSDARAPKGRSPTASPENRPFTHHGQSTRSVKGPSAEERATPDE